MDSPWTVHKVSYCHTTSLLQLSVSSFAMLPQDPSVFFTLTRQITGLARTLSTAFAGKTLYQVHNSLWTSQEHNFHHLVASIPKVLGLEPLEQVLCPSPKRQEIVFLHLLSLSCLNMCHQSALNFELSQHTATAVISFGGAVS